MKTVAGVSLAAKLTVAALSIAVVVAGLSVLVLGGRLAGADKDLEQAHGRYDKAQQILLANPRLARGKDAGSGRDGPNLETLRTVFYTVARGDFGGGLTVVKTAPQPSLNGIEVHLAPATSRDIVKFIALVETKCPPAKVTRWNMKKIDGANGLWKVSSLLFRIPGEER